MNCVMRPLAEKDALAVPDAGGTSVRQHSGTVFAAPRPNRLCATMTRLKKPLLIASILH